MKFNWTLTLAIVLTLVSAYGFYSINSIKNDAYEQGRSKGIYDTLYSVQAREVFLDAESISEFQQWKKACENKWKVDCGLGYFKIDGVGVYQVSPKQSY